MIDLLGSVGSFEDGCIAPAFDAMGRIDRYDVMAVVSVAAAGFAVGLLLVIWGTRLEKRRRRAEWLNVLERVPVEDTGDRRRSSDHIST